MKNQQTMNYKRTLIKNTPMILNVLYKTTFILLCSLIPAMQSCRQSDKKEILTEQQIEFRKKRDRAGLRLGTMLNNRDFEQALRYVDSLHREYPDDPQLYFTEGWAYDMLGDNLRARAAYTKSMGIYDSLIAAKPDCSDMINKALIVQILYGMEAYTRALDEIQSTISSPNDSLTIEQIWREFIFNKEELSFAELSNDTIK